MNTASILRLSRDAQHRISQSCPYKLRVFRSGIHRLGVRAAQNIPAGRQVIEYAGEKIARVETRRRFIHGSPGRSRKQNYLARLDPYWTIDGSVRGSGAELINHTCDPNLRLKKFRGRLWLFSLRRIRAGEELGYDYQFAKNGEQVICCCGSKKCRGTINCI
ncbi:MAG: SET domain-containing protein-lysine N-methyltransferase [Candidatus Acidiferrales bacterium]